MSGPRPLKRRRIYRACDQCRRRKSKCDGEQPVCSICHQANRACTYETGGGRRGLPSGYVRSLEITLGLMFQHAPNSESTLHNALRDSRSPSKGNFLTSKLAKHSVSVWRKSKPYRDVSQLLTPGENDVFDDSEWEPVEARDPDENMDDHDTAQSNPEPNKPEITQELPNQVPQSESSIYVRFPDSISDLVDFYFIYTHCWFPILERRSVLRTMHLGNGHGQVPGDLSSRIVLWSLVAYTSAMRGLSHPGMPNLLSLQLAIEQQALSEWGALDLCHIQAMLIHVLIHIAMGSISQAWTLVGKAARMLASLPLAARKARFNHTFNGCVLLDNILSALMGQAPCFSQEEQLTYGPIEEDDLEEWDVWSPSRPGIDAERRKTPATPLRALSTFNHVQQLMQQLSRILYQPLDSSRVNVLLNDLRAKQNIISRSHPYDRENDANPSLLSLHLVSAFTTISLCRRFEPVSSVVTDLCAPTIRNILGILDHYRDITGATGSSPLTLCFALQCQKCLNIANSSEVETLQNRISNFLHPLKPVGFNKSGWNNSISQPTLISPIQQESRPPGALDSSLSIPEISELSNSTSLSLNQPQSEPSSVMNSSAIPPSNEIPLLHSLGGTGDTEMYDALFEEMVTSFPASRYLILTIPLASLIHY